MLGQSVIGNFIASAECMSAMQTLHVLESCCKRLVDITPKHFAVQLLVYSL